MSNLDEPIEMETAVKVEEIVDGEPSNAVPITANNATPLEAEDFEEDGRADKAQVARMVHMLLGAPKEARSDDAADALAIALCCARRYRMDHLRSSREQT